jgi:autotransporter-associated beta strand protein
VQAGGAILDSAGFAVTNVLPMLQDPGSPGGGLTKLGAGTVTLRGTNTYTGDTTVTAGTLSLQQPALSVNSTVTVAGAAVLNLDFMMTNQVAGLVLGGVSQPQGVYDSITAAPYITGAGSLRVGNPLASSNAYLTSLVLIPPASLTPGFASNVFSYSATAAYGTVLTLIVTNADLTATNWLIYNNTTNLLGSGAVGGPLVLNPNPGITNVVRVQVTAQDGLTTVSYGVNVIQLPEQTTGPLLTNSFANGKITLDWALANLGYRLLSQTNSLDRGISTNPNDWATVPGSTATNTMTLSPTNASGYYQLVYP